MYLKSRVKLPDVHGKLTRLRRGDITYIKYEYGRYYDPEKKIYLSTESDYRQGMSR